MCDKNAPSLDILHDMWYYNDEIITKKGVLKLSEFSIVFKNLRKDNDLTQGELAKKLGKGKTVVTVLPDTGERYFSTELFEF